jgi:hypothetical protein
MAAPKKGVARRRLLLRHPQRGHDRLQIDQVFDLRSFKHGSWRDRNGNGNSLQRLFTLGGRDNDLLQLRKGSRRDKNRTKNYWK